MNQRSEVRRLAAATLMPGFVGTQVPDWIRQAHHEGLRSVALYAPNIADREALQRLCRDLQELDGLVVAVDEEGGDVTRVHYRQGSPEPGNAVLGAIDDDELTWASAHRIGRELAELGIALVLGPVLDINSTPENPVIGARSFSASPAVVSRHGRAWIAGMQAAGVAACAKHFPGHGDTASDSHLTRPVVLADRGTLETRELSPFVAAIAAGVRAVMTSHVLVPALDPGQVSTFSAAILDQLLRGELGFTGPVVTDALDMRGACEGIGVPEAAVRALVAGADLLCLGSQTTAQQYAAVLDAVGEAVSAGRLSRARLEEAGQRSATLASAAGVSGADPSATTTGGDATATMGQIAATFAMEPTVAEWLAGPGELVILQVETTTNEAVGEAAWGPATVEPVRLVHQVAEGLAAVGSAGGQSKVAVVGRGVAVGHPARELATALRDRGTSVITVDCGWPRGTADLVTRGGSVVVSAALVALLRGEVHP